MRRQRQMLQSGDMGMPGSSIVAQLAAGLLHSAQVMSTCRSILLMSYPLGSSRSPLQVGRQQSQTVMYQALS